jgi:hypothetical protein
MPFVVQRDGYILWPYFDWISSLLHPQCATASKTSWAS